MIKKHIKINETKNAINFLEDIKNFDGDVIFSKGLYSIDAKEDEQALNMLLTGTTIEYTDWLYNAYVNQYLG